MLFILMDDMKYKFIVKVFNLYIEKRVNNELFDFKIVYIVYIWIE